MLSKIGGYTIKDTRSIKIYSKKKGVEDFNIEVENDFVITDDWVENIMKDPDMFKCLQWLKKKNFEKDSNGTWSYNGNDARIYNIPLYFIDLKNRKLRINFDSFGTNVEKIKLPFFRGGLCSIEEFPNISELTNFCMTRDPSLDKYDNSNLYWHEKSFIHAYNKYNINNEKGDINAYYYKLLFKMLHVINDEREINSIKKFIKNNKKNFSRYPSFAKNYNDYLEKIKNLEKSTKTIVKFNL